jgi:hypothetical protein
VESAQLNDNAGSSNQIAQKSRESQVRAATRRVLRCALSGNGEEEDGAGADQKGPRVMGGTARTHRAVAPGTSSSYELPTLPMSHSPATSTSSDNHGHKRRRTEDGLPPSPSVEHALDGGGSAHAPKRGARACTNCRRGKVRASSSSIRADPDLC